MPPGGSEDVVADQLVEIRHVRVALELEPHLAEAGEPELELGIQVEGASASTMQRWRVRSIRFSSRASRDT
jgi:hypothetical protein